jgi:hypothetical protein
MKMGGQLDVEVTAMLGPGEYVPDATERLFANALFPIR